MAVFNRLIAPTGCMMHVVAIAEIRRFLPHSNGKSGADQVKNRQKSIQ
jgi:hypothetical protein